MAKRPELPVLLSKAEAIELIGRFLNEWKSVIEDDVNIRRIQGGYNNAVYVVSSSSQVTIDQSTIVVRKHGGNIMTDKSFLKPLDEMYENIASCEVGRIGLGPKVFGVFQGGRIEEFIDCRPVTPHDLRNVEIQKDLARYIAKFHAINVPLPRPNYNFIEILRTSFAQVDREKILMIKECIPLKDYLEHDFEQEFKFLEPLVDPMKHRVVFMHWDAHPGNMGIVRSELLPNELKTIIFDYELAGYNMRGKDVGLLLAMFVMGALGKAEEGQVDETYFPYDDEICKPFIEEYRATCEKLFNDWDPNGKDSYERILMESMIGNIISMLCYLFVVALSLVKRDGTHLPSFVASLLRMWNSFQNTRQALLSRFPNVHEMI